MTGIILEDSNEVSLSSIFESYLDKVSKAPKQDIQHAFMSGAKAVFIAIESAGEGATVADMHSIASRLVDIQEELNDYFGETYDDEDEEEE